MAPEFTLLRRRLIWLAWGALWVATGVAFHQFLEPTKGAIGALIVLPASLTGYFFGARSGVLAGVVAMLFVVLLEVGSSIQFEPVSLAVSGGAVVAVAAGFGRMGELSRRLKAQIRSLRTAEERLRAALASNPAIVFTADPSGKVTFVSESARALFHVDDERELMDRDWLRERLHGDDRSIGHSLIADTVRDGSTSRQMRVTVADGSYHWFQVETRLMSAADGRPGEISGYAMDINDRRVADDERAHRALFDPLTEIPNRVHLTESLRDQLTSAASRRLAVVILDLDHFNEINDAFGHARGDELLRAVAKRICDDVADDELVARLNGDRFAIVVPGARPSESEALGERLMRVFRDPIEFADQKIGMSVSVGIAYSPEDATDAEALIQRAEVAFGDAKKIRGGYRVYRQESERSTVHRLAVAADLRQAIDRDELLLHYQPVIDVRSGRLTHVEALLRWQHPVRGLVPPGEFIPVAERGGLMSHITDWVLATAMRQCWAWQEEGLRVGVAINISAGNLHDKGLPATIAGLLERYTLDAGLVTLEITESVVMAEPERAIENLGRLRAMGIRLAVDDFGTGYSSLAYLNRLPVDSIKIDRSFITDMAGDEHTAAIVKATIELAHTLGFGCVAEGVEEQAALGVLDKLGCDSAQGYLIARPMPASKVTEWLRNEALTPRTVPLDHRETSTVLVVDDHEVIRLTAELLLHRSGHEVLTAATAAEARTMCADRRLPIDLILLDVGLPDGDGRTLGPELLGLRPGVGVVYMSGNHELEGQLGRDRRFLAKPFSESSLAEAISGMRALSVVA